MRVLVFGDSITQGCWAVNHGWVDLIRLDYDSKQAEDLIRNLEPTVFNLGISADMSQDVLARLESEVKVRTRHGNRPVVVVQIGTNDSALEKGKKRISVEEYKENLNKTIELSKQVASKLILVGFSSCIESKTSPVFWGDFVWSNNRIKEYEYALREVAEENNIPFIPVFDKFKQAADSKPSILPDGLHPNDEGHKLIYEIVKPQLGQLLSN